MWRRPPAPASGDVDEADSREMEGAVTICLVGIIVSAVTYLRDARIRVHSL